MSCYSCSKPAAFETERQGKSGKRSWCLRHFSEKINKYEMTVVPLKTAIVKKKP